MIEHCGDSWHGKRQVQLLLLRAQAFRMFVTG